MNSGVSTRLYRSVPDLPVTTLCSMGIVDSRLGSLRWRHSGQWPVSAPRPLPTWIDRRKTLRSPLDKARSSPQSPLVPSSLPRPPTLLRRPLRRRPAHQLHLIPLQYPPRRRVRKLTGLYSQPIPTGEHEYKYWWCSGRGTDRSDQAYTHPGLDPPLDHTRDYLTHDPFPMVCRVQHVAEHPYWLGHLMSVCMWI